MRTAIRTLVAIVLAVSLSIPAQAVTFGKIKYLVSVGDKVKEIKCHLILTKETVQIRDGKTAQTLQELPYTEIQSVTYARSKHRRWKSGAGAALLLRSGRSRHSLHEREKTLAHLRGQRS